MSRRPRFAAIFQKPVADFFLPALAASIVLAIAIFAPSSLLGTGSFASYGYGYGAGPPCTNATLLAAPPSPQAPGTAVTLTGGATCPAPGEFRFWILPPGGVWTILRDYSPTTTYSWDTTGRALGSYGLEVDARNQGSTNTYET